FLAQSKARLNMKPEKGRVPPDHRVCSAFRLVQARLDGKLTHTIVADRPPENRGSGEFGTQRRGLAGAKLRLGRVKRLVQRTEPAIASLVADGAHDKQVARSGRGDVGHTHALGEIAAVLLLFMIDEFPRRAAKQAQSAEPI